LCAVLPNEDSNSMISASSDKGEEDSNSVDAFTHGKGENQF